jgi:hypothetical protein
MKEYTLVGKARDGTEDFSETETLVGKSHQDNENSIMEDYELSQNISTSKRGATGSRNRNSKAKKMEGSNSDYEIPTTLMKPNRQQTKRHLRAKKTDFKKYINELSQSSDEESSHIDMTNDYAANGSEDSSSENILNPHTNNEPFNSKVSRVTQKRNRKLSSDSTLDGSQAHKNRKGFNNIEASRFLKKPQFKTSNPNFACLVQAVKACERIDKVKDQRQKCDQNTTANFPTTLANDLVIKLLSHGNSIPSSSTLNQEAQHPIISLNNTSKILNLNSLNGLSNGSNVNAFFDNLREALSS